MSDRADKPTTNQEAYVQEIERRRQNGELDTAVPTTTTDSAEVAQRAVVAFMRDWNTLPPEDCAWRMWARLKTALSHMEAALADQ